MSTRRSILLCWRIPGFFHEQLSQHAARDELVHFLGLVLVIGEQLVTSSHSHVKYNKCPCP